MQAQLFLLQLKTAWQKPDRINLAQRDKNLRSMLELDISFENLRDICLSLKPDDCAGGPFPHDRGFEGEVWIFKPVHRGTKVYLKFWHTTKNETDYVQIISCHEEGIV